MQTIHIIARVLCIAGVATSLPAGPGAIAIGSARECSFMIPWQIDKPGYKWIWTCKEECVSWQFSDATHPECLRQIPTGEDENRYVAAVIN